MQDIKFVYNKKSNVLYLVGNLALDEWGILYYELLFLGETATGKNDDLQLNHLAEKNPIKRDLILDLIDIQW